MIVDEDVAYGNICNFDFYEDCYVLNLFDHELEVYYFVLLMARFRDQKGNIKKFVAIKDNRWEL